jgi:uncharacterized protein (UPF0335 family)
MRVRFTRDAASGAFTRVELFNFEPFKAATSLTIHEARPLTKEEGAQLYEHIRAIETLEEEKAEIAADIGERKTLCCERLPINKDVLNFVIKRRKAGRSTCGNFDDMLQLVEEAVHSVEHERRSAQPIRLARQDRDEAAIDDEADEAEADADDDADGESELDLQDAY